MKISSESQDKISQLQLIEQNLHTYLTQKQGFQSKLLEADNALQELQTSSGPVYKIVGQIMVLSHKDKLNSDLKERKEVLNLRIKSIEKQEKALMEKAKKLQAEVMVEIEKHKEQDAKPN